MACYQFSESGKASDYRMMRRCLFAMIFAGALLVVLGVQFGSHFVTQRLIEDGYQVLQRQLVDSYQRDVDVVMQHQLGHLQMILHNPSLIAAVRQGDRETLMRELYWQYQIKRRENPHLDILHVHDANNITLLRMHQPGQYGDDLSDLRPMIAEGNHLQATRSGFEIGKNGISYRIATPIQDEEGHLGMLEMGVNITYFTERLARIFGVQVATIFDASAMEAYLGQHGSEGLLAIADNAYAFAPISPQMQLAAQQAMRNSDSLVPFDYQGQRYVAHKVFSIRNYEGQPVGTVLVLADVSEQVGQIRQYTLWSSLGWLSLLGLLLFGQYQIFSRMQNAIHRLAFYDSLTKLPNRSLLMDRIEQTLLSSSRSGQYLALMFIDLDNFKQLNDNHGHHLGDVLLQQVAARLRSCVRISDTVARQGGDEFVVILDELGKERGEAQARAAAVAEKILAALEQPYQLEDGLAHHCTASIGIVLSLGEGMQLDELLKQADIAMYQAKAAGRNQLAFYQG